VHLTEKTNKFVCIHTGPNNLHRRANSTNPLQEEKEIVLSEGALGKEDTSHSLDGL
jgi:hypothetical protein